MYLIQPREFERLRQKMFLVYAGMHGSIKKVIFIPSYKNY